MRNRRRAIVLCCSIAAVISVLNSTEARAAPARVVFIRHGEKIDDTHSDLSPKGCWRANQLPLFFETYRKDTVAIYAQQPNNAGGSIRPIETVALTAEKFGLPINNRFQRDDVNAFAIEIMSEASYNGKTVLVAWEHDAILRLVAAFGFQLPPNLQRWPKEIFDQAWVLSFDSMKRPSLEIVAEHLLPTDIEASESGVANWGPEKSVLNNGIVVPPNTIASCGAGNNFLDVIGRKYVLNPAPGL